MKFRVNLWLEVSAFFQRFGIKGEAQVIMSGCTLHEALQNMLESISSLFLYVVVGGISVLPLFKIRQNSYQSFIFSHFIIESLLYSIFLIIFTLTQLLAEPPNLPFLIVFWLSLYKETSQRKSQNLQYIHIGCPKKK